MTLAEFLSGDDYTLTSFAEEIGVSAGLVHDWKSGRRFPSGRNLAKIERITKGKVRASDFAGQEAA